MAEAEDDRSMIIVPGNENIPGNETIGDNEGIKNHPTIEDNEEVSVIDPKVKDLRDRKEPVNILVIGPTFSGKSTLINAMFEEDVIIVQVSAKSLTSKVEAYKREHEGMKIKIYDTVGFGDTGGRTGRSILYEIAEHGQFDLILICTKLVERVDRDMFSELASVLHEDMWKRTVVVLTFANQFKELDSVQKSNNIKNQMKIAIDACQKCVVEYLSKSVNKEVLDKIPFCLAGLKDKRTLPIVDDWLKTLWVTSIHRSSDEARPFLTFYARNHRGIIETGSFVGSVGVGAGVGATIGTFIAPGPGSAIGAAVGAGVGGVVSLAGIIVGRIFK